MKITNIISSLVLLSMALTSSEVALKTGWNLIGIDSTDSVNILTTNQNITRAAGGGIGGGGDFNYNKQYSQYAQGSMKLGQGYWIKSDADTSLTYTKVSSASSIDLKIGWNLINTCVEINAADIINDYPAVTRAAGGGIGGGGDFNYNKQYAQYAQGTTKVGQGYWFKVDQDMTITCASPYEFRAWGIGGDEINSRLIVMVNGVNYTLAAYSKLDILSTDASTAGDSTTFVGSLNGKNTVGIFKISSDYHTHDVAIKVFKGDNNITDENLVTVSDPLIASNGAYLNYNIIIENPDDFRPIAPTDTSIAMPPVAPSF
ncbi:hypothetical protein N9X61_00715 [Sulfurimonas sp.]|nr:hypothetical protein [Sulfurimonas sp.]